MMCIVKERQLGVYRFSTLFKLKPGEVFLRKNVSNPYYHKEEFIIARGEVFSAYTCDIEIFTEEI